MEFVDRKSTYPNRYTMTDENGNVSQVFLERADEPIVEGTPLNAATFNALFLCSEGEEHPGCYYHMVDGEREWLNPPMAENVVYRTTKRFNGYPVYTVAAVFPTLAAAGESVSKRFTGGDIAKVLSISTTYYPKTKEDSYTVSVQSGMLMDNGGLYAYTDMIVNDDLQELTIHSKSEVATYHSAVCIVEFTKAEEAL